MLCDRLVFCAYAEDAGVFPKRDQFVDCKCADLAWMRVVAGRLKSDDRYSAAIGYNSFPWPEGFRTISQPLTYCAEIEKTALAVLAADGFDAKATECVTASAPMDRSVVHAA